MNILFLTNHLNIGGITTYVFTLASGLKRKGHNVYLASSGGTLLQDFINLGVNYVPIPIRTKSEISPKILISFFKLRSYLKEHKIDIVHSHSRTTQVLGCLLDKDSASRHVFTCHGFFRKRFSRILFPCWGRSIIAISEQVKSHLTEDFKVNQERVTVVHNGIDLKRFQETSIASREEAKKSLGLSQSLVVGIVARLSDVKGHIYLLEAMQKSIRDFPEAVLLIVGEGKMRQGLIEYAKKLGIEASVIFLPEAKDTALLLPAMDIFVLPSLKEGLGLALMEAMASGLAVIGSNVGGIKTLIRGGVNGLLFNPADSDALSGRISGLLQDKNKREALGKNAREFIEQNFSQEKMVSLTEQVYAQCLSGKK